METITAPANTQSKLHLLKKGGDVMRQQGSGLLTPPADFDLSRFAAKWAKEGNEVAVAMQEQRVQGTEYTAPGWQPWKDKDGKQYRVSLGDGSYILMFRPKEIQQAVQEAYGELSRKRLIAEGIGETVGGATPQKWLVTNQDLNKQEGRDPEVEALSKSQSTVVNPSLPTSGGQINRTPQKLNK